MKITLHSDIASMLPHYPLIHQLYTDVSEEQYRLRLEQLLPYEYRQLSLEEGGKTLAVAGFHIMVHLSCGEHIYIDDLVVDEAVRGQRYAEVLLAEIEAEGRKRGHEVLLLDSFVYQKAAHALYHRQRFAIEAFHFIKYL